MAEPERIRDREERSRPAREPEPMAARRVPRDESITEVGRELISDIGDLIRDELRMARREMQSDLNTLLRGTVWMTVGGVALFLGVTFLLLAAVFALGNAVSLWLSALIVGAVVLIAGGIFVGIGWSRVKSVNPLPERTIQTVREDAEWLQNRMR